VIPEPLTALLAHTNGRPLLTAAQEVSLAKRVERGDLAAKEQLVVANLRLVVHVARRYQGHGLTLPDLVQEGMLGLIRAAEKFDWRKGCRFSTYATLWIRQALQRGLDNTGRTIRIPSHMSRAARRVARIELELEGLLGRVPTDDEIAEAADVDHATVGLLRHVCREPTSLDRAVGEAPEGMTLHELLAA
jgi:RNA polymerase primary sigma factor